MRVLDELREIYREMAPLGERRRAAIRTVRPGALREAIETEAGLAARLRDLNRRRVVCVDAILRITGRPERGEPTASWVAERLPPELGGEVRAAADALRQAIEGVERAVATDRLAAESIAAHLRGVLKTVGDAVSHARLYGRSGEVERGQHQVTTLMDLTS